MNELAIFKKEEKLMTTKELAKVLGVEVTTVKRAVLKLGAVLHQVKKNSQGGYLFTEQQATAIKLEIQKHHNLASRQIDLVTTEEEENQTIANAIMILKRRSDEFKRRAEIAESALDRIANGKGCYTNSQAAKALQLSYGRNTFITKLKEKKIYMNNGEPYQEYINAGHFVVKNKLCSDGTNRPVSLVTGKGLVYLSKTFNTKIDESVLPDAE